jgi:hypothetical protein
VQRHPGIPFFLLIRVKYEFFFTPENRKCALEPIVSEDSHAEARRTRRRREEKFIFYYFTIVDLNDALKSIHYVKIPIKWPRFNNPAVKAENHFKWDYDHTQNSKRQAISRDFCAFYAGLMHH